MTVTGWSLTYTVDDLAWARDALGTFHVEIDEDGALVVSPASDPHGMAVNMLAGSLRDRGQDARWELSWKPPGGSGRVNVPDLVVLATGTVRTGLDDLHFDPPPLLVVEVASPTTRRLDRGAKMEEYRVGGARHYLLVDLPALVGVAEPSLELLTNTGDLWESNGPHFVLTLPEALGGGTVRAADLVFQGRFT
jgi:Uma2 family endonuclease